MALAVDDDRKNRSLVEFAVRTELFHLSKEAVMRRKLVLGLVSVAILGVAGSYFVNLSGGAQEPVLPAPKKLEPMPPDKLFETLKKDLAPSVPVMPPMQFGTKPEIPSVPVPVMPTPAKASEPTPGLPTFPSGPSVPVAPVPSVPNVFDPPMPKPVPVPVVPTASKSEKNPAPPLPTPTPTPQSLHPEFGKTVGPIPPAPLSKAVDVPALTPTPPMPRPSSPGFVPQPSASIPSPQSTTPSGPVKLKTSPWSLHVELTPDQTILTASVNKKHEFKIVCQHVDLQTARSVLRASGKVQISGDGLTASCDNLSIPLSEDRLVLEGVAEVRIRKGAADSSGSKAAFELKGESLNLRVSDLQSAKFVEATWRRVIDDNGVQTVSAPGNDSKEWSPYGKLRRTGLEHEGRPIWALENKTGDLILHFVTRDSNYLTQYEGRTISVLGTTMDSLSSAGHTLVRATHIALP
jgi:hypothetical protein